ncbi:MAG TPA: SAM-dependent methyltransferase [Allosphingosinicella sp.]|nr:SAM-dependent methyltransferase [Allosphingosinicella sp.]
MKASPEPEDLTERLARLIDTSGPISVAHYMAEANAHYYAARDPFGAAGDFTTAPEISQMFGELAGLWLADLWHRAGAAADACYVELGPGRGTLAADALRSMRMAGLQPPVHFVETSPVLRETQRARVPNAHWHDDPSTLPDDAPLLILANEFFDALPVRQLAASDRGWHELLVTHEGGRFARIPGRLIPAPLPQAEPGTIVETSPASLSVVRELVQRLSAQGGAALIVDYGHDHSGTGDTIQAVERHGFADPWERPGTRDLTAHVDFSALKLAAEGEGASAFGPTTQGEWLGRMGIDIRSARLAKAAPERSDEIETARLRLTALDQMGSLFKVLALTAPDWPAPAAFE